MSTTIKIIHNSDIELSRWDKTIQESANSRVYAESWYLDIVAPDWKGLIYGDYEYVMPLIEGKKYGINYCYQPTFVQQHGIFPPSTPEITDQIVDTVKKQYRFFEISFNSFNIINEKEFQISERKNFILNLKDTEVNIKAAYNSHAKRNTKKALKQCEVSNEISLEEYLQLKRKSSKVALTTQQIKLLKLIIFKATSKGKGKIYGAYNKKNELCAAAFFLYEKKRITYLNSVSNDEGKNINAMYAIIDNFIRNHAQKQYILDFEGSNIEGIARFFKGFGANAETYLHVKFNNLPWFLKLIKR